MGVDVGLRRVFCETVPASELAASTTIGLLQRFDVHPIVAVWPDTVQDARTCAMRFADAGLRPVLWPMLADADGRWLGAGNVARFCAFAERVHADADRVREILLDLEPPIQVLKSGADLRTLTVIADRSSFGAARQQVAGLAARLQGAAVKVLSAVPPAVLLDDEAGGQGWQLRLGTPVDGIAWDHVSPMLYASIVEGWSRGLLRRQDARAVVAWGAQAVVARFGARAGASLGAVGTGALGDEPTYPSPRELADDVAIATAAGVRDLALFELGGVLRRRPCEAWLEAFTAPPSTRPLPSTRRIDALIAGGRAAGRLYGALVM